MKKKIRVLIVEDEFITLDALREELEEIGYEISGDAMRAKDALLILEKGDTDIAILDIHLKGSESGIWLAAQITEKYKIPFIFLSAFSDRKTIAEAATTKPSSYLVKPFTPADLYASIELALLTYTKHTGALQLPKSHTKITEELFINDSIYVKEDLIYKKISIRDIYYVEAFKNYLELHLSKDRHVIRSTLKNFLTILPTEYFIQTHRSFVVNMDKIEEIGGNFLQIGDTKVPISRTQKEEVLSRLKFFF